MAQYLDKVANTDGKFKTPPDGGWAWMIVFGNIIVGFFIQSTVFTFGVLVEELSEDQGHGEPFGHTVVSGVPALFVTVSQLFGPVSAKLSSHYSHQLLSCIGITVTCVGVAICSISRRVAWFYVGYTLLGGIGHSLTVPGGVQILRDYFTTRRSAAQNISSLGTTLSLAFMPLLMYFLCCILTLRGAMLVWSSIVFNALIGAMFYGRNRKIETHLKRVDTNNGIVKKVDNTNDVYDKLINSELAEKADERTNKNENKVNGTVVNDKTFDLSEHTTMDDMGKESTSKPVHVQYDPILIPKYRSISQHALFKSFDILPQISEENQNVQNSLGIVEANNMHSMRPISQYSVQSSDSFRTVKSHFYSMDRMSMLTHYFDAYSSFSIPYNDKDLEVSRVKLSDNNEKREEHKSVNNENLGDHKSDDNENLKLSTMKSNNEQNFEEKKLENNKTLEISTKKLDNDNWEVSTMKSDNDENLGEHELDNNENIELHISEGNEEESVKLINTFNQIIEAVHPNGLVEYKPHGLVEVEKESLGGNIELFICEEPEQQSQTHVSDSDHILKDRQYTLFNTEQFAKDDISTSDQLSPLQDLNQISHLDTKSAKSREQCLNKSYSNTNTENNDLCRVDNINGDGAPNDTLKYLQFQDKSSSKYSEKNYSQGNGENHKPEKACPRRNQNELVTDFFPEIHGNHKKLRQSNSLVEILKHPVFLVAALSTSLKRQIYYSYIIYLPTISTIVQSEKHAPYLLTVVAVFEFLSRIAVTSVPCLSIRVSSIDQRYSSVMASVLCCISLIVLLSGSNFALLLISSCLFGASFGAILFVDHENIRHLINTDYVSMAFTTVISLTMYPVQGWTLDNFVSHIPITTILLSLSGVTLVLEIMILVIAKKHKMHLPANV